MNTAVLGKTRFRKKMRGLQTQSVSVFKSNNIHLHVTSGSCKKHDFMLDVMETLNT